jgi:hypothetical protein
MIMRKIFLLFLFSTALWAQSLRKDFMQFASSEVSAVNFDKKNVLTQPVENFEKKKTGLAIVYSLLLPGMGELYAGSYETGKYFTVADAALWGILIGFDVYGHWQEDNYKEYARIHGGVNPEGKDDTYWGNIGLYLNIDDYNREKELDRDFARTYDRAKYFWAWKNQAERREYRGMWKSSEQAYNAIQFAAGALILNRLASAVNAVRLVIKHNKKAEESQALNFRFGVERFGAEAMNLTFYVTAEF